MEIIKASPGGQFSIGRRGEHLARQVQFDLTEWIERYLRISHERIEKTTAFLQGRGAVMALFVALPYVGDAIAVVLGLMRSNFWVTTLAMMLGKAARYIAVVYAVEGIASLF